MKWLIHPIDSLRNWGVKAFVLSIVNTAIAKYNGNIDKARQFVARYIAKIEAVLAFLKSLDGKLADCKLTEEEADAIVDEAAKLAKELTA